MSQLTHLARIIALCIALGCALETEAQNTDPNRPNILIIMADDLGYQDLSSYGSPIQTPNLDKLAAQGIRFTDFYAAAPNCSPSRAGLLTGRTPSRVGVYDYVPPDIPMNLPDSELTIAEFLKPLNYATAHVGKWHLSRWQRAEEAPLESPTPGDQGFDYWFAADNNAVPSHHNPLNFIRNGTPVGKLQGYSCQLVADEGINWLNNRKNKDQPFFLNVWFNEPHRKIASPPHLIEQYKQHGENDALYYANVANMDNAAGRILKTLDEQGLTQNTLVLFMSDNGPWREGSQGPLRAKKSSLYEGGIRVPGIIRWPGHIKPGIETNTPASGLDILPTIAAITTTPLPKNKTYDGTSILPIFANEKLNREQPLYWFFYKSDPMCVIRDGDYILTAAPNTIYKSKSHPIDQTDLDYLKTAKMQHFQLYNIRQDITQTNDLSTKIPDKLDILKSKLLNIHQSMLDEGPILKNLPSDQSPNQ